jgi:hypothetical protein
MSSGTPGRSRSDPADWRECPETNKPDESHCAKTASTSSPSPALRWAPAVGSIHIVPPPLWCAPLPRSRWLYDKGMTWLMSII